MNRRTQFPSRVFVGVFLWIVATTAIYGQTQDVRLEWVDGVKQGDTIFAGDTVRFHILYANSYSCSFALSNAFKIYSRSSLTSGAVGSGSATWVISPPAPHPFGVVLDKPQQSIGIQVDTTGYIDKSEFGALFIFKCFSCDGRGADTVMFSGAANDPSQSAFPGGASGVVFIIWLVTNPADTGKVICIDSATNYPPSGTWKWPSFSSCVPPNIDPFPSWNGGRCFVLAPYECCHGSTGNIDCDAADRIDIADISTLIDHLYLSNKPLCCPEQADCDGVGAVDIADLSALINYLYISFLPLAPCP